MVLRSFGDRVKVLMVSVPLFPSLGRIQPWQIQSYLPDVRSKVILVLKPTVVKIGPSLCRIVSAPTIVTVGFVITHLSTHCLPSILVFIHHIYLFTISYSPLKSHTKNLQPFIGTDYLVLFALILLLASHHRYSSTVLLLIFPTHPPHILSCVC